MALSTSLFSRYEELPTEGKLANDKDRYCNPDEERCSTLYFVFETKCANCQGSGTVKMHSTSTWGHHRRRGHAAVRSQLAACVHCTGMGYVRCSTTRFDPESQEGLLPTVPSEESNPAPATIGRKPEATLQGDNHPAPAKAKDAEVVVGSAQPAASSGEGGNGAGTASGNIVPGKFKMDGVAKEGAKSKQLAGKT